jgi:hypothetical protein
MTRRARILFHDEPTGPPAAGDRIVGLVARSEIKILPPMAPRDEAVFLLHTAAEIEHALMVQYLYAAWSLPPDGPTRVRRWRREILQIAREEMAHFAAVQNLLRFVGGPLNFDREDFPYRTDLYPFPLRLEALRRKSLARYVAAEMPAKPTGIDKALIADAMQIAIGQPPGRPVNRVGALYRRLETLLAEGGPLTDAELRPDTAASIQARPERFRADVGDGPYFLRTVRTRAEALALLDDVADQGEGDTDMPRSHFSTFLDMFDTWPDDDAVALDVPTDPSARPRTEPGEDPSLITHKRAAAWATIFNRHYRMLLGWLQHALLTPHADPVSSGLCLRVFGEMLVLAEVGPLLTTLPRTADGAGRAGAPFELPYTLAFPDLSGDRWDYHRDLLVEARADLYDLRPTREEPDPPGEAVRLRLLRSVAAAQAFVDLHGVEEGS